MRIAILGLGLIGGSVARAVRRSTDWPISAWNPRPDGPERAAALGIIDRAASDIASAVRDAELVVLGAPPLACLTLLDDLARLAGTVHADDATVTDLASTKRAIVDRAASRGIHFVGGHPMAGRETRGFDASSADLFDDRPWITTPGRSTRPIDVERVRALIAACGAREVVVGPERHDRVVAGISHLPLLLAEALVEAVAGSPGELPPTDWAEARALAAGGWRDMTRLVNGDVDMATGIVTTNATALATRLRSVRDVLDAWLVELEREGGPDPEVVAARFASSRARLAAKP